MRAQGGRSGRAVSAPIARLANPAHGQQVALQAGPWSLEAGSCGAVRAGGLWVPASPQAPHPPRRLRLPPPSRLAPASLPPPALGPERAPRMSSGRAAPGPQGTWACFGPDCARVSPRTWSSFCWAAGSRQVIAGVRQCGPRGGAQRGGRPRPWHTRERGPSPPPSSAHSLLESPGRWEWASHVPGRVEPTLCARHHARSCGSASRRRRGKVK